MQQLTCSLASANGSAAAKALGMHIKRLTLIAQENGFNFADTSKSHQREALS